MSESDPTNVGSPHSGIDDIVARYTRERIRITDDEDQSRTAEIEETCILGTVEIQRDRLILDGKSELMDTF